MANRVSQEAVEVLDQSTVLAARVSQYAVEVLDSSTVLNVLVSQVAVEVLRLNDSGSSGATPPGYFDATWIW